MNRRETPTPSEDSVRDQLLVATGVTKTFDQTRALDGAGIELRAGEVHGLLGANGAGKSTLSKVIAGHVVPDGGQIVYRGEAIRLRSTREALSAGIAIVMQETSLVPDLTVAENIFLPELGRRGRLSFADLDRRGRELLAALGQEDTLPLDVEVRQLSSAQRQLVEIAKALGVEARLIIFDEPTASLSPGEVDRLFDIMARLRAAGSGLIFVSHRLEEVLEITDRVTIMREGRTVLASRPTVSLNQAELIRHMVGQDIGAIFASRSETPADAPVAFSVTGLRALPAVRDVSFAVRRGEILGLGGLVGAGRSEAVEAVFGLRPRSAGAIEMNGRALAIKGPRDAIRAGIGFVAEDRRAQNIVPDLSVKENLLLAHLGARRGFLLGYRSREKAVDTLMAALGLPAERLMDASMLTFSGGMQQKIILARWLLLEPEVLMLDEPTKGVDIATRSSIYEILRKVAGRGVAVVIISSDFEELLGLADRIVVISDGTSIADLPSHLLDEEKLTLLAAPRTSMSRNTETLQALSGRTGGTGFWALIDEGRMICLNRAGSGAEPGFVAGEAKTFGETRIPQALERRGEGFVREPRGALSSILLPLRSSRGHDLGWVGLTLDADRVPPDAEEVRRLVASLADTL